MKRLITAAMSLVMVSGLAMAVNSENWVGYNTVTVAAGQEWALLGNGLRDVAGNTNAIDVQAYIPNAQAAGFTATTAFGTSDQIWFWVDGAYQKVFLHNTTGGIASRRGKWINQLAWAGGAAGAVSTYKVPAGAASWLKRVSFAGEVSFTTPGEVVNDPNLSQKILTGWNFISSGYSAGWDLNATNGLGNAEIAWQTAGATATTAFGSSDQIWFWVGGAYQKVWLHNTSGGIASRRGKWVNQLAWAGGAAGAPTTYIFPYGDGAWYKALADFNFSQPRPFTLD